ncbi:GNAT family N-acetyltransferase [Raineyella sp.]|uniref:N-acetyltransferase domain-containing protein n=1 Tax=bioreactor metagenome TaxID=1076179 RepID=A0A644ZLW2_9ZZZZ|nr:GNAT family N-acetyltransferase [Raineyella sp.]MEA5154403.1 GNAT family N-acetyltransferase [Raineyella sp.]
MELRWAGPEDAALVEEALLGIADADPAQPAAGLEQLRGDPALSRCPVDFAAEGAAAEEVAPRRPFGVVAELAGRPVGLVWTVFSPADAPGPGFVSAEAPEVRLWVRDGFRGRGIGRTLLGSLVLEAQARRLPGLSVSVDAFSPAVRLFFEAGFRTVGAGGHGETMLLSLR